MCHRDVVVTRFRDTGDSPHLLGVTCQEPEHGQAVAQQDTLVAQQDTLVAQQDTLVATLTHWHLPPLLLFHLLLLLLLLECQHAPQHSVGLDKLCLI